MINRRLYLESPIEIQRLLIVLYKLGTIIVENNRENQSALQRAQDNEGIVTIDEETITSAKTIRTREDNRDAYEQ